MNSTLAEQIEAIRIARDFIKRESVDGITVNGQNIDSRLADASNTIVDLSKFPTEKECEFDLRELSHFYGSWDELKKVVARLEDNDNEDAFERSCNEPDAWEGGFADNH